MQWWNRTRTSTEQESALQRLHFAGQCTKILLSTVRHVGLARKSVFLEDRRCRRKALAFQEMLPYIVMRFVRSHDTELALPELPAL